MKGGTKILYLFDAGDAASRMPVAERAREDGYDVVIVLIGSGAKKPGLGFRVLHVSSPEGSLGPGALLRMVNEVRKIIADEKPALIHAVTLKYAFIAGLAALAHPSVKKIYTLAGLGYLFRDENTKAGLMRALTTPLLKIVLNTGSATLIFQNPDDRALMIGKGFATQERSVLILGSGVDLERFRPLPETGLEWEKPVVLMPTRLVREKGVQVFIEAARMLKKQGVDADFQIAGGVTKHNPKALSTAEMDEMTADGAVRWLGRVDDMPALLNKADLVVYPSYYGEGIPRVLLEACAAGCAIVTTDHPGCREAVTNNENGLLVPVRNVRATAQAIRTLLEDVDLRRRMEAASRARAEQYFDIRVIAAQTCDVYKQALAG